MECDGQNNGQKLLDIGSWEVISLSCLSNAFQCSSYPINFVQRLVSLMTPYFVIKNLI